MADDDQDAIETPRAPVLSQMAKVQLGLEILRKYKDAEFCAEHDEVFAAGPDPKDLCESDAQALESYGWRWSASLDSWRKFV